MWAFFRRVGRYLLARAQERTTVAGVAATVSVLLGFTLPPDMAGAIVTTVVAVAGVVASLMPGGK